MYEGNLANGQRRDVALVASQLLRGAVSALNPDNDGFAILSGGSTHGRSVDELEAAGRVFMLAAMTELGESSPDISVNARRVLERLLIGVGARGGTRGVFPTAGVSNGVVEAAGISLALWLSRDRIWLCLDDSERDAIARWLGMARHADVSQNNWILFPLVVNAFLDRHGYGDGTGTRKRNSVLRQLSVWTATDGWYSDGQGGAFDYYNSWSFHYYVPLLANLSEDDAMLEIAEARMARFLPSFQRLFGSDGSHVAFGRSLTYRFAASAAFSAAETAGISPLPAGVSREAILRNIGFFAPDLASDYQPVPLGWRSADASIAQPYSGPFASYWFAKTFACLALEEKHAFWSANRAIPADMAQDGSAALGRTGLLVQRTDEGRTVRLYNHGSNNLQSASLRNPVDDRFYSRTGYSNGTMPVSSRAHRDYGFGFTSVRGPTSRYEISNIAISDHYAVSLSAARGANPWFLPGSFGRKLGRLLPVTRSRRVQGDVVQATALVDGWSVEICVLTAMRRRVHAYASGWALRDVNRIDKMEGGVLYRSAGACAAFVPLVGLMPAQMDHVADRHTTAFPVSAAASPGGSVLAYAAYLSNDGRAPASWPEGTLVGDMLELRFGGGTLHRVPVPAIAQGGGHA